MSKSSPSRAIAPEVSAAAEPAKLRGPIAHADLTKSPFSGVMRWAPNLLKPRSLGPEDVVAYFRMLQETYGTISESVMHPECLQALWAVAFYLKRFGKVSYSQRIHSLTANGVCGFVRADGQGATATGAGAGPASHDQFIKFQVSSEADDIRTDALSAVAMSKILEYEATKSGGSPAMMQESIMKYSDAFIGVLETNGPVSAPAPKMRKSIPDIYHYNIAQQIVEARLLPTQSDVPDEMQKALKATERSAAAPGAHELSGNGADLTFRDNDKAGQSYLKMLRAKNPNAMLAPAVAFDAINGISLSKLIDDMSPTASFSAIAQRLEYLYRVMRVIGQYGWIHNDVHLENILHDRDVDHLVLIDYGRTFLDPRSLPSDIGDSMDREMLKLDMLLNAKHLRGVTDAANGSGIQAAQKGRYVKFMDDKFTATRQRVITPQLLAQFQRVPANFAKCLFMFDLATVTLGIMRRVTRLYAPAKTVAAEFEKACSVTNIAKIARANMTILDFDSFISVLESPPLIAGVPAHMHVILLGLLWTSMVMTAIRDDALYRGDSTTPIRTAVANTNDKSTLIMNFIELSGRGIIFAGGLQFHSPCINDRVMKLFPRMEGYIQTYFDTGFLVAPPVAGGMLSVTRSAAMRARFAPSLAPSLAVRARAAARPASKLQPISWNDSKKAGDPLDPSAITNKRREKPTAWARKALAEYVSPLAALPPVFRLDAEGKVVPVNIAPGSVSGGWKKRAAAKRGGSAAASASDGEEIHRIHAMLEKLPVGDVKKTERLLAELENTRPFVLGAARSSRS